MEFTIKDNIVIGNILLVSIVKTNYVLLKKNQHWILSITSKYTIVNEHIINKQNANMDVKSVYFYVGYYFFGNINKYNEV